MFPGLTTKLSEATIASTTTITQKTDIIRLTGSTAIATINPSPTFSNGIGGGLCILIPTDGTLGLLTTGNIALAVTMAQAKTCILVWSNAAAKWYPGAIS